MIEFTAWVLVAIVVVLGVALVVTCGDVFDLRRRVAELERRSPAAPRVATPEPPPSRAEVSRIARRIYRRLEGRP